MKINSISPSELLYQYIHVQKRQNTTAASSMQEDKVELTGDAKSFSSALKIAKDQLEIGNTDRVSEIKKQIEQQTYSVPAILVAEKMLGKI